MAEVLGYTTCKRCGSAVTDLLARAFGGFCLECTEDGFGHTLDRLKVLVEGSVVDLEGSRRSKSKGTPSKAARRRAKKVEKAKLRAMKGLRDRHWAEYLALLAMERQKLGLVPMPPEMAPYLTKEAPPT